MLLVNTQASAQPTLGAREVALGQAATALPGSSWSIFGNPAMGNQESSSVSFFGLRYYGMQEITDMAAVINIASGLGAFGLGAHRFGDDLYNESRLRAAYKNSYEGFHLGLALTYHHVVMGGGYGTLGAIGIDVGLGAEVSQRLWIGANATNINRPAYGSYMDIDEELARSLNIGFGYTLADAALVLMDVYKDVRFPISYRGGFEVEFLRYFRGRAGITTEPISFSGGFGYANRLWAVNIVVQKHENPALGMSPGLDLEVKW